ncbi:uncharacterized membrane protein YjjB (DUF3815 family) [Weissella uvarum]|uniref:threonine/serine exporter family protein n=1 Tax=Weissella uvarum TaxID=1479233 RepID=UPI0019620D78|nr:threonine/serine exporter family protein [Weissella uvarum]MBM7617438.1 uncharacterized membrane protein YjjB (DUF3815 family) [Weissella uvarum]MCM0595677.1 threonine/serine exporter family protein [Weissella uvarum]
MSISSIALQILLIFGATIGFAMTVQAPNRSLLVAGTIGAISYVPNLIATYIANNIYYGVAFGVASVTALSFFAARRYHIPAFILLVPGLVPYFPGQKLYLMIMSLFQFDKAVFITNTEGFVETSVCIYGSMVAVNLMLSFIMKGIKKYKQA